MEEILKERGAERWIQYEVTSSKEPRFRQEKRGRPGNKTRWRRDLRARFHLTFSHRAEQISYDARCDGVFPLLTNCPNFSFAQVLETYKSKQPMVEKRHDLLKNVEAATPMYLKSISRIEALLFVYFVALMVHALIERQVRTAHRTNSRGLREPAASPPIPAREAGSALRPRTHRTPAHDPRTARSREGGLSQPLSHLCTQGGGKISEA